MVWCRRSIPEQRTVRATRPGSYAPRMMVARGVMAASSPMMISTKRKFCMGTGRWLAACRTHMDAHMQLFASDDDGRSWHDRGPLSLPAQCPSHFTRLADGRILFTFAMRNLGLRAVAVRFSNDEGASWSAPQVLLSLGGCHRRWLSGKQPARRRYHRHRFLQQQNPWSPPLPYGCGPLAGKVILLTCVVVKF